MKRMLFVAVSLLWVAISGAQAPVENALLWRISGKGLADNSYLYGTIHLIDKKDFFLTDSTKILFARARRVTFEVDMEEMSDVGGQFSMMMKVMMPGDTTLQDLLDKDDYKMVQDYFGKLGLPLFLLEKMKPMFLSSFVMGDLPVGEAGSEMMSYELEFLKMAKSQDKKTGGLESLEFQMSVFDSIPYRVQARMLVESLKSSDQDDNQLRQLVDLYKKQDLQGLQRLFNEDKEGVSQYESLLLDNRNATWIPVMEKMMREQATFFAVGAGHLTGDKGVVSLLRKAGYTLQPVR